MDIHDSTTNTWSVGPSMPVPVDDYLAVILDSNLYVIGGDTFHDLTDRSLDTVWQLLLA